MPNVKIRITSDVSEQVKDELDEKKDLEEAQKRKIAAITLVAQQAVANTNKALNYAISNRGNFTGDYTKTEGIQFALGLAGDLATIGVGFSTGPVGGFVALAGVALARTFEAVSYFQDIEHKNIESNYLKERSGNSLINGSRGTED